MIDWNDIKGALFDLDGVLTPTAKVHESAWKRTFDGVLSRRDGDGFQSFTEQDYLEFVDGKPRYEGVRSFLESRDVALPYGSPTDTAGDTSICAVGNTKNAMFNDVLTAEGVEPYPDAVILLDYLATTDIKLGVVSSSANAVPVLRASGLIDRFQFVMDGLVARDRALPGKPDPATFVSASNEIGVPVSHVIVFEDAVSGVQAGAGGGFHTVVGVDRTGSSQALMDAGATVVVDDLSTVISER